MSNIQQMRDPSAGVPPQLLPHLHLISKNRYPQNNNPSLEMVVGWLLEAPKVLNELQPVQWQPLDCPTDGTIILTWQPPELGTTFSSDGYVWHDHEVMFNSDVRGYNLQMHLQRAGFRPGADAVASHSRRRYRLMPSQQNAGADPSIWLIHYSKASQRDHIPANSIQIPPQVHASLQQRRVIFSQGALPRKDFMLRDRSNWPTINAPGGIGRQGSAGQLPAASHRRGPSIGMAEPTVEEEEDVSRGDVLDFMTPRDVSRMRYEQHHEWMEEILESPYRTLSIIPPELGLGRKGELENLTKGFFAAPLTVQDSSDGTPARVGRLEAGKAEEFTKLANQRLNDMQTELDKMRQAHQKRMEKLRKSSTIGNAERRLRALHLDASKSKGSADGEGSSVPPDSLDDIASEVEASVGKKIQPVKTMHMVSKGGFQPDLSVQHTSSADSREASHTDGTHGGSNQQQTGPSAPGGNANATETDSTTAITAQNDQQPNQASNQSQQQATSDEQDVADVEMKGLDEEDENEAPAGEGGDWVMVDDQDLNLGNMASDIEGTPRSTPANQGQTPLNTGLTPAADASATVSSSGAQSQPKATEDQPQQENLSAHQTPIDTVDFDLGTDFDNTAGDALADFNVADELDLDTMDDSAFGDAFPPED